MRLQWINCSIISVTNASLNALKVMNGVYAALQDLKAGSKRRPGCSALTGTSTRSDSAYLLAPLICRETIKYFLWLNN